MVIEQQRGNYTLPHTPDVIYAEAPLTSEETILQREVMIETTSAMTGRDVSKMVDEMGKLLPGFKSFMYEACKIFDMVEVVEDVIEEAMRRHAHNPEMVAEIFGSFRFMCPKYSIPLSLARAHAEELITRIESGILTRKENLNTIKRRFADIAGDFHIDKLRFMFRELAFELWNEASEAQQQHIIEHLNNVVELA